MPASPRGLRSAGGGRAPAAPGAHPQPGGTSRPERAPDRSGSGWRKGPKPPRRHTQQAENLRMRLPRSVAILKPAGTILALT